MIFDRIMLPAQGRSEDYKFAQTGTATLASSVGGPGGGVSTPSWLENVIKLDPESGFLSVDDWHVKGNLVIEGQVNQWLAQQLVVDDARIQVNRKQDGATVDSGLVIFDKDTSTEVSSLVYDVSGVWKAGGDRLFTEAYNPKLGGYSAASYPRKAENAVITGAWKIDNNLFIGGTGTASERLHVVGNGLFTGNLTAPTFVSGFAGSGWRLEAGTENHLTVDRLTVRGRMDIYELVVNQIRGTNGALWVSDSAKVASVSGNRLTIDTGGDTSFVPFVVNDLLRCQRWNGNNVKYYVVRVTAVGSNYIDVALVAGSSPREAGDYLVRMGNTEDTDRQGALYLTSSDNNATYMDVLDGVNSASFAGKTKVRIGRLDGITDPDLVTLSGYGLYTENGYFKGKVQVTGGNAATKADVDAAIDSIEVGGRNLLLGTGTGEGWSYSTFENGVFTRSTSGTSEVFIASIGQIDLERNTKYTLSAWIKSNGYVKDVDFYVYNKDITNIHSKRNIPVSTNWEFVTFTFTTADADYSEARIRFDNNGSTLAGTLATLYVKMPKLEKGDKATDWTPAPEDVPSALDYLAKAIQGSTEIDGGLTMTNLLLLKNEDGDITGGMSGLDDDNVLLFGGGDYQAALDSTVQTLIRKDGSGLLSGGRIQWDRFGMKVGALDIDSTGALLLRDGEAVKLLITQFSIMPPEELIGGGQSSETSFTSTTNTATGVTEVLKDVYLINNDGTEVTVTTTLSALVQLSDPSGYSTATIQILARYPGTGMDYLIDSYSLSAYGTTEQKTGSYSVNATSILPAGTMYLIVRFENVSSVPTGFNCSASAGTIKIFRSVSDPHIEIGINGFVFSKDSYNFTYFGVDSSNKFRAILRSTGDFDMPGLLLRGTVDAAGGNSTANWWGPKKVTWTPSKTSTGRYVVYHDVGHVDYTVTAASRTANRSYHIVSKSSSQFIIEWRSIGSSPALIDTEFDFQISGLNFLAP